MADTKSPEDSKRCKYSQSYAAGGVHMEGKLTSNLQNAWKTAVKSRVIAFSPYNYQALLQSGVSTHTRLKSFRQSKNLLPEIAPTMSQSKVIKGAYGMPLTETFTGGKKSMRPQYKKTNMTSAKPQFTRYSRQQISKMAGRSLVSTNERRGTNKPPNDWMKRKRDTMVRRTLQEELVIFPKLPKSEKSDLFTSDEIIVRELNPQQRRDFLRGTVLQRRNMKFHVLKSLCQLPLSLRNSIDFSNPEYANYWATHVGDPLLDIIFDLYLTENRRHMLLQHEVPEAYVALFNAQNVNLTMSHINTFLHDVLAEVQTEGIDMKHATEQTVASPLRRQKLPVIQDKSMLNTLLKVDPTKLPIRPMKTKEDVLTSTPMTAVMEGPEFPTLVLTEKCNAPNTLLSKKKRFQSPRPKSMLLNEEKQRLYEKSCYEKQLKIISEKVRSRWKRIFHRITLITRISRTLAERSYAISLESKCFIDIGDDVTAAVSYGEGRSINPENYKKRKEITFCNDVRTTLGQLPEHRTLVQLDQAVMELQKIAVFSKYPLEIQEKMIRKGLYLRIGPRRIIVRQGQRAQYFYIAVSGEAYAKQTVFDPEMGCEIVRTLKCISPGMTFGELALIRGSRRTASVVSRVPMQLIGVHVDDFYEIFITPKLMEIIPDHVSFLRKMDIMVDWPIEQLMQFPSLCKMEYFRSNTVITFDSWNCPNLYIVRTGYCKVFRMLEWKDFRNKMEDKPIELLRRPSESGIHTPGRRDSCLLFMSSCIKQDNSEARYLERESESVSFRKIRSPRGRAVKLPVVQVKRLNDPIDIQTLRLPSGKRKFVPLKLLGESDVFGLDQLTLFPDSNLSHSVIMVSMGAECIALNKILFCQFANKETSEIIRHKAFVYNTDYIRRRLNDPVNVDVHLETILEEYFYNNFQKGFDKRQ